MPWSVKRSVLAACLATFLLQACGQTSDAFVGTWHSEHEGSVTTWHFYADGTFVTEVLRNGATGHARGLYTVTLGEVALNSSEATTSGPGVPARELKELLLQPVRLKVGSIAGTTMTLTGPSSPLHLVRLSPAP